MLKTPPSSCEKGKQANRVKQSTDTCTYVKTTSFSPCDKYEDMTEGKPGTAYLRSITSLGGLLGP